MQTKESTDNHISILKDTPVAWRTQLGAHRHLHPLQSHWFTHYADKQQGEESHLVGCKGSQNVEAAILYMAHMNVRKFMNRNYSKSSKCITQFTPKQLHQTCKISQIHFY